MPWTSFLRGDLDGIRQSIWDIPRSKRLARDGAFYGVQALFFYMQGEYEGAYLVSAVSVLLCLISAIYVNIRDHVPKYICFGLSLVECSAIAHYALANGDPAIAYEIAVILLMYAVILKFYIVLH